MNRRTVVFVVLMALAMGAAVEAKYAPVRRAREALRDAPPSPYSFDRFGRLIAMRGKKEMTCPPAGERTEVLLTIGQSNAANHAGQRFASKYGARIVNFFAGKCYLAASPLLGASGHMGESWTLLANKMIASGLAEQVVIVPTAIGDTPIARWASGDLRSMLSEVLGGLQAAGYKPTRVIWHQGESDFVARTDPAEYVERFRSVVALLRSHGVNAPIYAAVATRGERYHGWSIDNPLAKVQRHLPGAEAVVDTDALITDLARYDGVHFSMTGQEQYTDALLKTFREEDR